MYTQLDSILTGQIRFRTLDPFTRSLQLLVSVLKKQQMIRLVVSVHWQNGATQILRTVAESLRAHFSMHTARRVGIYICIYYNIYICYE